jgi:TorA maturation chaperone TorD
MNDAASAPIDAAAVRLLAHADLVFLLADLLRPPAGPAERWEEARQSVGDLLTAAGIEDLLLALALDSALLHAASVPPAAHSGEYHRLFEGRLLCPPNETAYIRRDKGGILADICGFYRAFGFEFRTDVGERPDHIVTELEFCGVLLAMIASAPGDDQAQVARDALISFADCHLGEWLPWLAGRLQLTSELAVYRSVAASLAHAWSGLSAAHGLRQVPSSPMDHLPEEPDEPFECGASTASAPIQPTISVVPH